MCSEKEVNACFGFASMRKEQHLAELEEHNGRRETKTRKAHPSSTIVKSYKSTQREVFNPLRLSSDAAKHRRAARMSAATATLTTAPAYSVCLCGFFFVCVCFLYLFVKLPLADDSLILWCCAGVAV
jgi:hypothetical protein